MIHKNLLWVLQVNAVSPITSTNTLSLFFTLTPSINRFWVYWKQRLVCRTALKTSLSSLTDRDRGEEQTEPERQTESNPNGSSGGAPQVEGTLPSVEGEHVMWSRAPEQLLNRLCGVALGMSHLTGLKYFNNYWMMNPNDFGEPLIFRPAPPACWILSYYVKCVHIYSTSWIGTCFVQLEDAISWLWWSLDLASGTSRLTVLIFIEMFQQQNRHESWYTHSCSPQDRWKMWRWILITPP